MSETDTVLARNLSKGFASRTVLQGIDLQVTAGQVFGVLGANGAGKTTLIRLITGILQPDTGSLTVLNASDPAAIRHRIGYLPEEKGLYRKMRVLDYVVFAARLKGLRHSQARMAARTSLERVGLADRASTRCDTLSKGLGQKVQIAATIVHEPDLLVLDEPFSGLDPVNVELVRSLVLEHKRAGRTVLFSTHVMEQAEQICDALAIVHDGCIAKQGTLAQVKAASSRTIHIDFEGDAGNLQRIPGVAQVHHRGQSLELTLSAQADAQEILQSLARQLRIRRFETGEASLQQIFLRTLSESP